MAQRAEIQIVEGARMVAKVGDHEVAIDFSEKLGGTDTAPTPTQLFVTSIAACKLFYAYRFLVRRGVDTNGSKATVTWEGNTKTIERVNVKLEIPGGVDPSLVDGCMKMVNACYVAASIEANMQIDVSIC